MSFFDPDYNPRADYDMDGEVDDFEFGMFLNEMEDEDRAIENGSAFFGTGSASYEPNEDYIGLDLEHCTILDPDYDGSESLDELASRYGIDLTEDDIQFYRESQSVHTGSGLSRSGNTAKIDETVNKVLDEFLMEHSPEYRRYVNETEARRRFEAKGQPVEDLRSWKRHAPKESLAKYRERRRKYIGECILATFAILFFIAAPVTLVWVISDSSSPGRDDGAAGATAVVLIAGLVFLGLVLKFLVPSMEASTAQYKRDIETMIIVSNENEQSCN